VPYEELIGIAVLDLTKCRINLCRYNKDHLHLKYPIPKAKRSTTNCFGEKTAARRWFGITRKPV